MAVQSSTLAWRIPWTKEPGGLQSMGSHRVRQDLATEHADMHVAHGHQVMIYGMPGCKDVCPPKNFGRKLKVPKHVAMCVSHTHTHTDYSELFQGNRKSQNSDSVSLDAKFAFNQSIITHRLRRTNPGKFYMIGGHQQSFLLLINPLYLEGIIEDIPKGQMCLKGNSYCNEANASSESIFFLSEDCCCC